MRLMVDRSPQGGEGRQEAAKLKLQPPERVDLLHWVGDAPALLVPDSPKLGLPSFGFALTTGVNAHRSAIMRPSPSRTNAMAAFRLRFKVLKTPASRAANSAALTSRTTDESRLHQTLAAADTR